MELTAGINRAQPLALSRSLALPVSKQECGRIGPGFVVLSTPRPTPEPSCLFLRPFQYIIPPFPVWSVLSLRVAPFLAPSLVGEEKGTTSASTPVCLPLTRHSVNQLINQSVSSRSQSPYPHWKSTDPSVVWVKKHRPPASPPNCLPALPATSAEKDSIFTQDQPRTHKQWIDPDQSLTALRPPQ